MALNIKMYISWEQLNGKRHDVSLIVTLDKVSSRQLLPNK